MSFIPPPYRYHPHRKSRISLSNVVLALILAFFAAICLIPAAGCGTYMARVSDGDISDGDYYPATQMDYMFVGASFAYDLGGWIPVVCAASLVDLPFSLATDTLLLPYDLIKNNTTKGDTP